MLPPYSTPFVVLCTEHSVARTPCLTLLLGKGANGWSSRASGYKSNIYTHGKNPSPFAELYENNQAQAELGLRAYKVLDQIRECERERERERERLELSGHARCTC